MADEFTNHLCAAKGCTNTRDQGVFVGRFCAACDAALVTGEAKHGTSWVFRLKAAYHEQQVLMDGADAALAKAEQALTEMAKGAIEWYSQRKGLLEWLATGSWDKGSPCDIARELLAAPQATVPYVVQCDCPIYVCARGCGTRGPACAMVIKEGDEWECPTCNARCNDAEEAINSGAVL